jgi:lipopolysaccharide export system permease protein
LPGERDTRPLFLVPAAAAMTILGRYIFRQTATALAMLLITLTLIIWLATALRQLSLMTSQGQTFFVFLKITILAMPNLIAIVAPVALLISALHTLNRLSGDSELIVISASGATIWRVARPYLGLALLLSLFVVYANAFLTPYTSRILREYTIKVRTDLIGQFLQPGKFNTPEKGLTIHIGDRAPNGDLLGLLINDERDTSQYMTYLAERGQIMKQEDGSSFLIMRNGHIHRRSAKERDAHIITFESYLFNLAQFGPKEGERDYKPRERYLSDLLYPAPDDTYFRNNARKMRAELHDRLSNPLYPVLFVMIVIVHLGFPRTTRDSRLQSVFTAFAVAATLRVVGLAAVNASAKSGGALFLVWGVPVAGILITLLMARYEIRPLSLPSFSLPKWGKKKAPA